MSVAADDALPVRQVEVRSGPGLTEAAAFERWEAHMSETYFPLAVSPVPAGEFHGWISCGRYGDVEVTAVGSTPQQVRRTDRLIADDADEYLLAGIFVAGRGRLQLGGRVTAIGPGEMVLYRSGRRYRWDIEGRWEKTVVQVPISRLTEHSGLLASEIPDVIGLPAHGPAGLVSRFFRDVADLQRRDCADARLLMHPALDLLTAALRLSSGSAPGPSADALARRRILDHMRANCHDPALTVERIAQSCMMSRRTLYRMFEDVDGGPATVLRRMRVELAARLLIDSALPVGRIAKASGFAADRHFYRAFRGEMGTTPTAFRAAVSERSR
ncbi:AraC family transcriptional regulator [Nocardia sp. 2]|uniref:AraC family transcriptional regulator n=1 Tax=Nocardia acididurans TaxID=2802282 RepID=A0ABS1M484_9NOCA|nr:AraC family transcriptional regulator [Nocardia acididurans]MBL1075141.1 AraC family transcriptional regulator [Nocardia acididurans]